MTAVVVLKRNTLEFHFSDLESAIVCQLPSSAVADMEVISEQELETTINRCLGSLPKRGMVQTGIIVADELCFSVRLEPEKEEEAKKMLLSSCPFVHVATVTIKTPNGSIMTATNQDFYETFTKILETYGLVIQIVVPEASLALIDIKLDVPFDKLSIKRFFDLIGSIKPLSFPYVSQGPQVAQNQVTSQTTKSPKLQKWMVVFIAGAILYAGVLVFLIIR